MAGQRTVGIHDVQRFGGIGRDIYVAGRSLKMLDGEPFRLHHFTVVVQHLEPDARAARHVFQHQAVMGAFIGLYFSFRPLYRRPAASHGQQQHQTHKIFVIHNLLILICFQCVPRSKTERGLHGNSLIVKLLAATG